jgi:hypothetical protein
MGRAQLSVDNLARLDQANSRLRTARSTILSLETFASSTREGPMNNMAAAKTETDTTTYALRALASAALVFGVLIFVGLALWEPRGGGEAGARHLGFVLALAAMASGCTLFVAASPLATQRRPARHV